MRFVIVNGLPYILGKSGNTYSCRWDDLGFTPGPRVDLPSVPDVTYSEISILAQCAGHLDSIGKADEDEKKAAKRKKKASKGGDDQ